MVTAKLDKQSAVRVNHVAQDLQQLEARLARKRGLQAMLRASRQEEVTRLLSLTSEAPPDEATAALERLCGVCEQISKVDARSDDQATAWLLRDGVALLGGVFERRAVGLAFRREAAWHQAALCSTLLVAARAAEAQNPDCLQHALQHLQHAAPACIILLHEYFQKPALMVGKANECLALAVTTAELAEAASHSDELLPFQNLLLGFVDGCRQQLSEPSSNRSAAPSGAAAEVAAAAAASSTVDAAVLVPPAACPQQAPGADVTAAAALPHGGLVAGDSETPAGWDVALGFATVALARLATESGARDSAGGSSVAGGGNRSGGGGGRAKVQWPCCTLDASFAACLAAAQALLDHCMLAASASIRASVREDAAVAKAIATPLCFGPEHLAPQQQHLLHIGRALELAVAEFAANPASGIPAGDSAAGGATADSGQACLLASACRVHRLAQAVPFAVQRLLPIEHRQLSTWATWQPWSEAVTACLQRLLHFEGSAAAAQSGPTAEVMYQARMWLLGGAHQALRAPLDHEVAALQQPPVPALLSAVACACRHSPTANHCDREQVAELRGSGMQAAYAAASAVAEALAGLDPETALQSVTPPLLRSTCCAVSALLRVPAELLGGQLGGSLWQHGLRQHDDDRAVAAHELDLGRLGRNDTPWQQLQQLARLVTRLLRGGLPAVAERLCTSGAPEALLAALAPPPPPPPGTYRQRRQRLAAGAEQPIADSCTALAAMCRLSSAACQAVSAEHDSGSWSVVSAAIRQALPYEAAEVRWHVEEALQQVDQWLDRQQEGAAASAAAGAAATHVTSRNKKTGSRGSLHRTVDSAEAAMHALLLEEEKAAAAAARKAVKLQRKGKLAAAFPGPGHGDGAHTAACGIADASTSLPTVPEAGAAAAADAAAAPGPAAPTTGLPAQQWMRCPIISEVMRDPVLCEADGQSYERAAITAWLQQHGTSFVSGAPAQTSKLIPNYTLRSIIEAAGC